MKRIVFLFAIISFLTTDINAQSVGINYNGAAPNTASALDIDVSAIVGVKKGLLIPRISLTERTAITLSVPAQGLMVYQTDGVQGFYYNTSLTTTPNWVYVFNTNNGVRWDQLQAPTSNLTLDHGSYYTIMNFNGVTNASALAISSNSLTSGDLVHLNVTSTAAPASGQVGVLSVNKSGVLTNPNVTSAGVYSSVTNTGGATINTGGYFFASGASVDNNAVYGTTDANNGRGVVGENTSNGAGTQYGLYGRKIGNASGIGYGVYGNAGGTAALNVGGSFLANGGTENYGVSGATVSDNGRGVYGSNGSTGTGTQYGVYGEKSGATGTGTGYGVYGTATGTGNTNYGGYFTATGASANHSVHAETNADGGVGVFANNYSTGNAQQYGLLAIKQGSSASGIGYGVYGSASGTGLKNTGGSFSATGATNNIGVEAVTNADGGYGVYGRNYSTGVNNQYGVYGEKIGNTTTGTGYGVFGIATGTGANNFGGRFIADGATSNSGIYSTTSSNNSKAIWATNSTTGTGTSYAVLGQKTGATVSGTGYAFYGTAVGTGAFNYGGFFYAAGATSNIALEGSTDANGGTGVIGSNTSNGTGTQIGIYGVKGGATGTGIGYGVYGTATGSGASNIGGYFTASGATNNYAAVFEQGNVGVGNVNPTSALQVAGSFSSPCVQVVSNLTLNNTHHTILLEAAGLTITLPAVGSCIGREYVIINHQATPATISTYYNFTFTAVTTIPANSSLWLQTDGNRWYQIK